MKRWRTNECSGEDTTILSHRILCSFLCPESKLNTESMRCDTQSCYRTKSLYNAFHGLLASGIHKRNRTGVSNSSVVSFHAFNFQLKYQPRNGFPPHCSYYKQTYKYSQEPWGQRRGPRPTYILPPGSGGPQKTCSQVKTPSDRTCCYPVKSHYLAFEL